MINEIIRLVKTEALNSGACISMDISEYRNYLEKVTLNKINNYDVNSLILDFDIISGNISLTTFDEINVNLNNNLTVKDLILELKFSFILKYIVNEASKSFKGFDYFSIN